MCIQCCQLNCECVYSVVITYKLSKDGNSDLDTNTKIGKGRNLNRKLNSI